MQHAGDGRGKRGGFEEKKSFFRLSLEVIRSPEIERRSDVNLSDLFVVSFSYAIGLGAENERTNN